MADRGLFLGLSKNIPIPKNDGSSPLIPSSIPASIGQNVFNLWDDPFE